MPNLIVLRNEFYNDIQANYKLPQYCIQKRYMQAFSYTDNMIIFQPCEEYDVFLCIASQFALVQGLNQRVISKLNHIILAIQDVADYYGFDVIDTLLNVIAEYYSLKQLQAIITYHFRGDKNPNSPHIHIVVNHVGINGQAYYGRNEDYYDLMNYIKKRITGIDRMKWGIYSKYTTDPFYDEDYYLDGMY